MSIHTGAGEPVEVSGAGSSGAFGLLLRGRGSVSRQKGGFHRWCNTSRIPRRVYCHRLVVSERAGTTFAVGQASAIHASCAAAAGPSPSRPKRSECRGRPGPTGLADTRPTARATSSGSWTCGGKHEADRRPDRASAVDGLARAESQRQRRLLPAVQSAPSGRRQEGAPSSAARRDER